MARRAHKREEEDSLLGLLFPPARDSRAHAKIGFQCRTLIDSFDWLIQRWNWIMDGLCRPALPNTGTKNATGLGKIGLLLSMPSHQSIRNRILWPSPYQSNSQSAPRGYGICQKRRQKKKKEILALFLLFEEPKKRGTRGLSDPMAHDIDVGSFVTSIFFPHWRCLSLESCAIRANIPSFSAVCSFVMRIFCFTNRYIQTNTISFASSTKPTNNGNVNTWKS